MSGWLLDLSTDAAISTGTSLPLRYPHIGWLEESVVDVGGLKRAPVAAGQVTGERTQSRRRRERRAYPAGRFGAQVEGHRQAGSRRLEIALDAGDLAGQADAREGAQAVVVVQMSGGVDEGVAMDHAKSHETGRCEARQQEEARTEHGARRYRVDIEQSEILFETGWRARWRCGRISLLHCFGTANLLVVLNRLRLGPPIVRVT